VVSRIGNVTARHLSSGRQPNSAALNRGRHLCSAGRPSRLALAHILVEYLFQCAVMTVSMDFSCINLCVSPIHVTVCVMTVKINGRDFHQLDFKACFSESVAIKDRTILGLDANATN